MGWLHTSGRDGRPVYVEIGEVGVVAGRLHSLDLHLDDGTVSRRHARFYRRGERDLVEDLGSTNGTRLNGRPLTGAALLEDGDELRLGDVKVHYASISPADATPMADPAPETGAGEQEDVDGDAPAAAARERVPPDAAATSTSCRLRDTPRWKNVRLIGAGGMGEVYRADDRDLATPVAIKRLRRRGDGSEDLLTRLHAREASIARTIRHPNVVQVLEDGVYDGDPYMLLEWVEGPTLDRYRRRPRVDLAERIEVLRQIALGLAAAHASGVVHADLKPANVLVVDPGARDAASIVSSVLEDPDEAPPAPVLPLEGGLEEEIGRRLGRAAGPDFTSVAFTGRDGELALLDGIAAEVEGEGDESVRWVLVCGERGAGKRRLVAELRRRLDERGCRVPLAADEEGTPPPPGTRGLWVSLLPPVLPDDVAFLRSYQEGCIAGVVREIYLKPFLRGQSIRAVEALVGDAPSARAFVDAVDAEVGGNPRRLLERLQRSFEEGAWTRSGGCYRLDRSVLTPDPVAASRRLLDRLADEEKGLRDFLGRVAPLGDGADFAALQAASELPSASLYYLIDYAVRAGYLRRSSDGDVAFPAEPFRIALAKRVDAKAERRALRRALPHLVARLDRPGACARAHAQVAELERRVGHEERAFRHFLRAALRARGEYDRERFIASLDAARAIYRATTDRRGPHRVVVAALDELLGAPGRGLAGLDRLRRLPTDVRVRLTDFGIARRLDPDLDLADTPEGEQPWGTPRYMSPEQARREALTSASDVYSLGILARELLEDRHPLGELRGRPALAVLREKGIPAPAPGSLPGELPDLIGALLAPAPAARPSAAEVARRLQAVQLTIPSAGYR